MSAGIENRIHQIIVPADEVAIATKPRDAIPPKTFLDEYLGSPIEACSNYKREVVAVSEFNVLIGASCCAYTEHRPLVLSPDIIWLTLTQGLANHINENPETLRHHFVSHEGKARIDIRRDEFIKGSLENDWASVMAEFSQKIKGYIGADTHRLIVADFSTTDAAARAASEVTLMGAMQSYFDYGLVTLCGIPYFVIKGTVGDWERMYERVSQWAVWDLQWWVEPIKEVLAQFVLAARGDADRSWWRNYFKIKGGSGGVFIGGWVNWLFPYLDDADGGKYRNGFVGDLVGGVMGGSHISDFPISLAKAPFCWEYYDTKFDYQLVGGLVGIEQSEYLELEPRCGWAVMPVPTQKPAKPVRKWF